MKKYIRTKDGCITEGNFEIGKTIVTLYGDERITEENTADTIEELCDEFVIKVDNEYLHAKYYPVDRTFYIYNTEEEISLGECLRFNYVVKGAIWTDKGLQFVARMNSKGEFELLWKNGGLAL